MGASKLACPLSLHARRKQPLAGEYAHPGVCFAAAVLGALEAVRQSRDSMGVSYWTLRRQWGWTGQEETGGSQLWWSPGGH